MSKKIILTFVGLALACGAQAVAAEHPEHPTGSSSASHEHPQKQSKEHPKEHPHKPAKDQAFKSDFEKVVKDYVASEAQKSGGAFTVKDEVAGKDWKLTLVRVHKNKICMLDQGKSCFACADFKEVGGKNKLDLDFFADKAVDGAMTINKVVIHKVNGKPRFTYDKNNNPVPVK